MTAPPPDAPSPAVFAANVRALLTEDWRRYRCFGCLWYFVKALLRKFYDRHAMPMLGDYDDASVNERIPDGLTAVQMIALAVDEYRDNAATRMLSNQCEDFDGQTFTLIDPDMPG